VAGEAELLTLAVAPPARRRGRGRALLAAFEQGARERGACEAFLEVAADNAPAVALYAGAGYSELGRRPGYYSRAAGAVDALLMGRALA
jgi:ribosomal-protein-alanine N-acetyltransferase